MAFDRKKDMMLSGKQLRFLGVAMFQSTCIAASVGRRKVGWAGFYYVLAPKTSQLFHSTTKKAFAEFPVNANWIWNLVQASKVPIEDARSELVKSAHRPPSHLASLEKLSAEMQNAALVERMKAKELLFALDWKPFKKKQACAAAGRAL